MTGIVQVKRRNSGAPGAPASLKSGELAYSAVDDVLSIGKGDDGAGTALVVVPVAGRGAFAALDFPTFTGTPRAPTVAAAGDSSTLIATTAFVQAVITALINAAPASLNTLKELADAVGNDPNFSATVAASLALKAPIDSPVLTGTPIAPTPAGTDNSTKIATTAFVVAALGAGLGTIDGGTF